jgi:hypothetical protein
MNVGAEARAMQNSETYEEWIARQLVERDALAARYDEAVQLLGRWLDGLCPSQDTESFLTITDRGSET